MGPLQTIRTAITHLFTPRLRSLARLACNACTAYTGHSNVGELVVAFGHEETDANCRAILNLFDKALWEINEQNTCRICIKLPSIGRPFHSVMKP